MGRSRSLLLAIAGAVALLAGAARASDPDDPLFASHGSWGQTYDDQ